MKSEFWAPGKPSFIKPYCGSGALMQWTLSSLATRGTAMKEQSNQQSPKKANEEQPFSETRNGNIRRSGKPSEGEKVYCNEATQSGPPTHSQSHQAQNTVERTEVKQRRAWREEEIREVIWCYMYCRQRFTENYKSPACEKDVADALRTTLNWKAPRRDQIANFVLSNLQQHTSI